MQQNDSLADGAGASVELVGAALRAAAPGLRQTPQVTGRWAPGGGAPPSDERAAWGRFLANETARSRFIASAVGLMKARSYDGYNLDLEQLGEGKGSAGVDHVSFGRFLDEFANAVHAAGGRLSSDIDWCGSGHWWDPHYDYMSMQCSDYAAGKLDSIAMMKTYLTNKRGQDLLTHFEQYLKPAFYVLGAKLRVGIDCQVGGGDNVTAAEMFALLDVAGVNKIALWHNGWYPYFGGPLKAWARNASGEV